MPKTAPLFFEKPDVPSRRMFQKIVDDNKKLGPSSGTKNAQQIYSQGLATYGCGFVRGLGLQPHTQ
jgi:hypothetical protein